MSDETTVCILCLDESLPSRCYINLSSEQGVKFNMRQIIKTLFSFLEFKSNSGEYICLDCWKIVSEFDNFYQLISYKHRTAEVLVKPEEIYVEPAEEQYIEDGSENLFTNAEIKDEVGVFGLFPQTEAALIKQKAIENNYKEHDMLKNTDSDSDIALSEYLPLDRKTKLRAKEDKGKSPLNVFSDFSPTHNPGNMSSSSVSDNDTDFKLPTAKKAKIQKPRSTASGNDPDFELPIAKKAKIQKPRSRVSDYDPDFEFPTAKKAKIRKSKVVKQKRRRKPAIAPLSREEIEKRKSRQIEYNNIISKFFTDFPCTKCGESLQSFDDMKRHFRTSHNIDSGHMSCCGRNFYVRKQLAEHLMVHINPEHFKCSSCNQVFQESRTLEVHEHSHTNPKVIINKIVYKCDKCPKTFATKNAFEYHSISKHVPKSEYKFTCTKCNKKLPTKRTLRDHMKHVHDPTSVIICDKCGIQFRNQWSLKQHHKLEHSDEPKATPERMECQTCGKWLHNLASLRRHVKTIHEEAAGEHRCHICNKTSINARSLKRHIEYVHKCERKFKCTMCDKAFKRPQDIREHTSTHTGEVLYRCPNCPMTFFSYANLHKHRTRLHRAEWEADRKKPNTNIMRQAGEAAMAAIKLREVVDVNIYE